MQNTVSKRLKNAVERSGGTLKNFANKCGIPYRTLQDYVAGKLEPGAGNLIKISTHMGISLDYLLIGEGSMYRTGAGEKKIVDIKDAPKESLKEWLEEFWKTASDEEKEKFRRWFEVEVSLRFPHYKDWLQKKELLEVRETAPFDTHKKIG